MNMKLVAGRDFEDGQPNHDQVIINEEAAKALGFDNANQAVGVRITFRTRGKADGPTVIGVLKNFYFRSPKEGHLPMLFIMVTLLTILRSRCTLKICLRLSPT
jgi:putative ABC transport system permease protein